MTMAVAVIVVPVPLIEGLVIDRQIIGLAKFYIYSVVCRYPYTLSTCTEALLRDPFIFFLLLAEDDSPGGGSWSLSHLPDPSSPLVLQEKQELQAVIGVTELDNTFHLLGRLSGTAYYAAVGYADRTLQQEVMGFYNDIKGLHESFSSAFGVFVNSSDEALRELAAAFQLLIQGERVRAVSTLEKVSHTGQRLAGMASTLQTEASSNEDKLTTLLRNTEGAKSTHEDKKQEYERKRRELEAEKSRVQTEQQNAAEAAKHAKQRADEAKRDADKENKKQKDKKKGPWGIVIDILDDVFNIELLRKHQKREKEARHEQHLHEQKAKDQQVQYQQAEQKLRDLGSQLQKLQENVDLMDEAVESLRAAVGELRSLSVVMRDVTTFLKSVQGYCEYLVRSLSLTETEMSADTKHLAKIWESPQFQSRAEQLYAKWQALKLQSMYYLEMSDGVHDQIAGIVAVKQPTIVEARRIVKLLKEGRRNIRDEL